MKFRIISEDEKSQEELLEAIRRRHHHDDGSEAKIGLIDGTKSIERKVIEEENLWRQQTRQNANNEARSNNDASVQPPPQKQRNSDQPLPIKKQPIMAGCNCGKSFSAQKDDSTTIKITAFDNLGKVSGSYTVTGDSSASYGVPGQQSESYAASGNTKENYS